MRNMKFPFLQSLFSLVFITCFFTILLFAVEDYFGIDEKCTIAKISVFNVGFDYWHWLPVMFCSGIAAIVSMFLKKDNEWSKTDKTLYLAISGFFLITIILSFGMRLSNYLNVKNTAVDPWLFVFDVFSVILYFGFAYLSTKRLETGDKKFSYITIGIYALCFVCAFVVSNYYMPRGVMTQLNQDFKTITKVNQIASDIQGKKDPGELPEGISIRDDDGKKIISWNMVTDFENLDKKIKITKRLKYKFGGDILIPGINQKHKQGQNERIIEEES